MKAFVSQYKCAFILAGLIGFIYGTAELYEWYDLRVFKELCKDERNYVIEETTNDEGEPVYRLLWPNGEVARYSQSREFLVMMRTNLARAARMSSDSRWGESPEKKYPEIPVVPKGDKS